MSSNSMRGVLKHRVKGATAKVVGGLPLQGPRAAAFQQLRAILRQPVDRGEWPGAVACAVVGGRLRFVAEAGYADIEKGVRMTSRSLVRIYSMTKCVVAAALLQLVDEGLIGLDDTLSTHLPAFKHVQVLEEDSKGWPTGTVPAKRAIRIRHLLTHTSGIAGGAAPGIDALRRWRNRERAWIDVYKPITKQVDRGDVADLETWVDELAKLPLWSHPGEHYCYGYSYDVLGRILELKTGKPLGELLRERIFQPLAMNDTGFDTAGAGGPQRRRLAVLYRRTKSSRYGGNGLRPKLVRIDPPQAPQGAASLWTKSCKLPSAGGCVSSFAGGLLSTLDDYAKFLLAVVSGGAHPTSGARILSPAMAAEMLADQTAKLRGFGKASASSRSPYSNAHLGISCLGECQRRGAPHDGWFDGVEGVRLWGGAANTAFKYDPNGGNPLLVLVLSQVVPQDSGVTATALMRAVREAVAAESKALTEAELKPK